MRDPLEWIPACVDLCDAGDAYRLRGTRCFASSSAAGFAPCGKINSAATNQHGGDVVGAAAVERGEDQMLNTFLRGQFATRK